MLNYASEPRNRRVYGNLETRNTSATLIDEDGGGLDLRRWIFIIRRQGLKIAIIAALFALVGAVYALQLPPRYTATATLMIDPREQKVANIEAVVSGIGSDAAGIESQLEIIRSTETARRVAQRLGIDATSVKERPPGIIAAVAGLVIGTPDSATAAPQAEANDGSPGGDSDPLIPVIRALQSNLAVVRKSNTYLIEIRYTDENRREAARIANAFADDYLVDQLESRFEATRRANRWLEARLAELRTRVRESENAVQLFKTQHNIVDDQGATLNDEQIAKLNEELIVARAEAAQARVKFDQLKEVVESGGDPSSFADGIQSQAISQLRARISETRRELAELRSRYGVRHPRVVSAQAQLNDLQSQLENQVAGIVAASENAYRIARSRGESIEDSLRQLANNAAASGQVTVRLRELEREAAANQTLFEAFLSRFKETEQQESLPVTDTRIIERAALPNNPSAPNRRMIVLLFLMFGLTVGGGLAFLLETIDRGFRSIAQVEELIGIPVLASLPRVRAETSRERWYRRLAGFVTPRGLVQSYRDDTEERALLARHAVNKPLSAFAEAIRSLRLGIRYADIDNPAKVILITSALPGEGKTTVASNLAQQAAKSGERVLLIDMDLRHPSQTAIYTPKAKQGVVDVIVDGTPIDSVMYRHPLTGLCFIPATRQDALAYTSEVLGSQKAHDFIREMARTFDLVVIDASPLIPVTDGRVLINAADAVVLVIQWEKTSRDAVDFALQQSFGLRGKLIGATFNDMIPERAKHYDYYQSGYYAKNYPYYSGGT